jgi:F0F1-type ATP synthase delta subunit
MAKISRTRIATVIVDKLDAGSLSVAELSQEIAAYLLTEGRSGELDSLLRDIMQVRQDRGLLEVLAHTAYPIDNNTKAEIKARVTTLFPDIKQIIITEVHDSEVIAGVRLELANEQLDLSVRAKLNLFKQLTTA